MLLRAKLFKDVARHAGRVRSCRIPDVPANFVTEFYLTGIETIHPAIT